MFPIASKSRKKDLSSLAVPRRKGDATVMLSVHADLSFRARGAIRCIPQCASKPCVLAFKCSEHWLSLRWLLPSSDVTLLEMMKASKTTEEVVQSPWPGGMIMDMLLSSAEIRLISGAAPRKRRPPRLQNGQTVVLGC